MIKKLYSAQFIPKEESDKEGYLWYYSYGSNMNRNLLENRRRILPKESKRAIIKNYQLTFDYEGVPWIEPVFGNIQEMKNSEVHGVGHRITLEQFHQLQKTEGGGGENKGYDLVLMEMITYEGEKIDMWTLKAHQTLEITHKTRNLYPSQRYLNIMKLGAKESKLDEDYLKYMEKLPTNKTNKNNSLNKILVAIVKIICMIVYGFNFAFLSRENYFTTKFRMVQYYWKYCIFPVKSILWALYNILPDQIVNTEYNNDLNPGEIVKYQPKAKI